MIIKNRIAAVALSGAIIAGQLIASPVTGLAAPSDEVQTASENTVKKEHKGSRDKTVKADRKKTKDVSGNCIKKGSGEKKEKPDKKLEKGSRRADRKTESNSEKVTEEKTE